MGHEKGCNRKGMIDDRKIGFPVEMRIEPIVVEDAGWNKNSPKGGLGPVAQERKAS
jgi:hypothetical protein